MTIVAYDKQAKCTIKLHQHDSFAHDDDNAPLERMIYIAESYSQ
jgi:hypothetical protein